MEFFDRLDHRSELVCVILTNQNLSETKKFKKEKHFQLIKECKKLDSLTKHETNRKTLMA